MSAAAAASRAGDVEGDRPAEGLRVDHQEQEPREGGAPSRHGARRSGEKRLEERAHRIWLADAPIARSRPNARCSTAGGGPRALASGFGISEQRLEYRVIAQRIKLRPLCERHRREVSARNCALQVVEAAQVLPDITKEPALLKDGFGIVEDLQVERAVQNDRAAVVGVVAVHARDAKRPRSRRSREGDRAAGAVPGGREGLGDDLAALARVPGHSASPVVEQGAAGGATT